ncbi:hypothetical protein D3C87_1384330 [compost metagenome]
MFCITGFLELIEFLESLESLGSLEYPGSLSRLMPLFLPRVVSSFFLPALPSPGSGFPP